MDHIAIVVLGAVCAGFVQGLSGFGLGLTAMSFWAWSLDPKLAAALGGRLYVGISEARFRQVVLSLLTASGVALLASSLPALLH